VEGKERALYPVLPAYDHCLKCSHLFNLMDRARRDLHDGARGVNGACEGIGLSRRCCLPGTDWRRADSA